MSGKEFLDPDIGVTAVHRHGFDTVGRESGSGGRDPEGRGAHVIRHDDNAATELLQDFAQERRAERAVRFGNRTRGKRNCEPGDDRDGAWMRDEALCGAGQIALTPVVVVSAEQPPSGVVAADKNFNLGEERVVLAHGADSESVRTSTNRFPGHEGIADVRCD